MCGWRTVVGKGLWALPPADLLRAQADWLGAARSRLLRRAGIARRRRILDLGAGYGAVTEELVRRGGGEVVALDRQWEALRGIEGAWRVGGEGEVLPFRRGVFDLVWAQCFFLWVGRDSWAEVIGEIRRVLDEGGVLVAIEPDYGGMMEYPAEVASRDLWLAGLTRAGAEPLVGRMLPSWLAEVGFEVEVGLLERVEVAEGARWDLLAGLPLTAEENGRMMEARRWEVEKRPFVHLPFFLITAWRQ
ncbi:MAG TPA: class I SAM-dependent methyltransferase [Anaerolineae bacterium]|nr:class I SAM-dependent methyltransferase [Anaerolineae bacterium]